MKCFGMSNFMPRHVMSCCVVLCCVALRCVVLCCVALRCVGLVVLCCVVLCCVVLCCVVLCCVVLCCVVLCCVVLCCVVLCCVVLVPVIPKLNILGNLRANFIGVHRHEYFPLLVVKFDCCKINFDNPVLLLTRSNVWLQVTPCTSPPVIIEQLRVMLEPGSTVI